MRRFFLVFAMLALLVISAMPAMAQSWDRGNNNWWDDDNKRSDRGNDWWDDDKDRRDHDNNVWCGWFPSWHGWDYWCYSPWWGWWQLS
jgi:hypothetical protein